MNKLGEIELTEVYNIFLYQGQKISNLDLQKFSKNEENLNNFHQMLKNNNELFDLFLEKKIKLFSSKSEKTNNLSLVLFGDFLPLKLLFNNQELQIKNELWNLLFLLYCLLDKSDDNKVLELVDLDLYEKTKKTLNNHFVNDFKTKLKGDNVNENTSNLLDDLMGSFNESMDDKNPFENIMKITKNLTSKYKDDMMNGNIEVDKLMGNMTNLLPDMSDIMGAFQNAQSESKPENDDGPVIIDDNFSTSQVKVGKDLEKANNSFNLNNIGQMVNKLVPPSNSSEDSSGSGENPFGKIGGLFNIVKDMKNINAEEDALNLKEKMDSFFEKEMGFDMKEFNESLNNIQESLNLNGKLVEEKEAENND